MEQPFEIARLGIGYAPDDRRIFPDLSTEENLLITDRLAKKNGGWTVQKVYELFPQLERVRSSKGGKFERWRAKDVSYRSGFDEQSRAIAP